MTDTERITRLEHDIDLISRAYIEIRVALNHANIPVRNPYQNDVTPPTLIEVTPEALPTRREIHDQKSLNE